MKKFRDQELEKLLARAAAVTGEAASPLFPPLPPPSPFVPRDFRSLNDRSRPRTPLERRLNRVRLALQKAPGFSALPPAGAEERARAIARLAALGRQPADGIQDAGERPVELLEILAEFRAVFREAVQSVTAEIFRTMDEAAELEYKRALLREYPASRRLALPWLRQLASFRRHVLALRANPPPIPTAEQGSERRKDEANRIYRQIRNIPLDGAPEHWWRFLELAVLYRDVSPEKPDLFPDCQQYWRETLKWARGTLENYQESLAMSQGQRKILEAEIPKLLALAEREAEPVVSATEAVCGA